MQTTPPSFTLPTVAGVPPVAAPPTASSIPPVAATRIANSVPTAAKPAASSLPTSFAPVGAPTALSAAFNARCAAAYPQVSSIIRRQFLPDEDAIISTVWLRAWPHFPAMLAREQVALAAGRPSPHNWIGYF